MKRCMLSYALLWVLGVNALAQTQGIAFDSSRSWKKIVEKARDENKLIFVDCNDRRCEPCKQVTSRVFRLEDMGEIKKNQQVVLSYELRKGVPVIKLMINGHTYFFLFDTCAGITCVSDKLVNMEKLSYWQTGHSTQRMSGQVVMAEIPELVLGELVVKNKQAAVMSEYNPIFEQLGVDGTIGANIINDYVVTVDSKSKTITFDGEADASIARWNKLELWNNVPLLSIRVKGKNEIHDVSALFDTGNGTGAIGLPSVEGFEQWTREGIIGDVEEVGFIGTMVGGMVKPLIKDIFSIIFCRLRSVQNLITVC